MHDFEDMRDYLSSLIPEKVENEILCRVLKEIWISQPSSKISEVATDHEDIQVQVEESKNEIEHVDQNEKALYISEGTSPSLDL